MQRRDPAAARAGDEDAEALVRELEVGLDALQELQRLLRLLGVVALVVLPEDLVLLGIDDDGFHSRRADIQSDKQVLSCHR